MNSHPSTLVLCQSNGLDDMNRGKFPLQVQGIFLVSVAARLALKLAESLNQWLPASPPAKEKRLEADLHLGAKLRTRGAIPGVHKFSKNLEAISKF
jgi:hypothetical protein